LWCEEKEAQIMAVPTNIKTLLSGNVVEWARIEFKETWDAEASLKTICAFANDIDNWGGGYIVIGVAEQDGRPVYPLQGVPVEKIDGYLKDMLNKCRRIQPEYMPIVEVADYEGKKFIVVWAPGGNVRPYSSPKTMAKDNKERIYYIRKMSSTIAPSEEEKRDLYNLANRIPFDDRVNHEADLTDLNITLIKSYLKEIGSSLYSEADQMSFEELCKSMNIISTLPEYTKPKNVGLMFFSMEPDRIIIVSHPGADRSISTESLRAFRVYSRRYRNRRIGEFLKEMHLTEGRNTGFRKIRNALRNNGSPEPLFETDEERTYFATTLFIHPDFGGESASDNQNDGVNDGVSDGVNKHLSVNEKTVLSTLKEEPTLTAEKIASRIGVSKSTVERAIKKLKAKGMIERSGGDKKGRWMIL